MTGTRRLLVAVLAVVGLSPLVAVPLTVAPAAPAAAQSGYTFGTQPYEDVVLAAGRHAVCGLTRMQLAALMVAPTFPETGTGVGTPAPSPMTLSRYDTQAALYSFSTTSTRYPRAFFHPGIGAWQFDSAGGWDLTAADAINTHRAADQAAATMAHRWCNFRGDPGDLAARRAFAWAPWHACGGNRCEVIYQAVYSEAGLRLSLDPGVTRTGGMEARTCVLPGRAQFQCFFVDPARAQGHRAFTSASFGPSPISTPFYVFRLDGREHRWWLRADSGYDATVSASKPVTANARTMSPTPAITWATGEGLCDVSASRGACTWTGWSPFSGTWAAEPAIATNLDGRLEAFAARADGVVYNAWQPTPNGPWGDYRSLSGPTVGPVRELAAGRNPDGRLEVFALHGDGSVSHAFQMPTGGWSGWYRMGGVLDRDLSVGVSANGALRLFGLDPSGRAVTRALQPVGGWGPWTSIGGPVARSLAVGRNLDGRLEVYVIDTSGALHHTWQRSRDGAFGDWWGWGGSFVGRPAVATNADGRLEVFLRLPSGGLVHSWQLAPNSAWSPFFGRGGSVTGDPIVATNPDGRLEIFATVAGGLMAHSWQDRSPSGWSGWLGFEGLAPVEAVTGNGANRRIVLVARGPDGRMHRNSQLVG